MTASNPPPQLQRQLNDIAARLAQVARESPDLSVYFRAHAECVVQALRPVGIAYELVSGRAMQRIVASNLASLKLEAQPEQAEGFRKAIARVVETGQALVLAPRTPPPGGRAIDAALVGDHGYFNATDFEQVFIPIPLTGTTAGVVHAWFPLLEPGQGSIRASVLQRIVGEAELYLRSRRSADLGAELARVSTYAKLLEELAGEHDLEAISWNIVNYAREAVGCERVTLFVARGRGDEPLEEGWVGIDADYDLQACSGLRRPHPRSEQAVHLKALAERLTQMSLAASAKRVGQAAARRTVPPPAAGSPESGELAPAAGANGGANGVHAGTNGVHPEKEAAAAEGEPEGKVAEVPQQKVVPGARPQMQLTLVKRDPTKVATRPAEVNEYFDRVPMNWATVLPLYDRQNRVRGILLFEGLKLPEKLDATMLHMRDLAVSAGRALGAAIHAERQPAMRLARRWIRVRQKVVATPARERLLKWGVPVVATVAVLLFPVDFDLKGTATVLPRERTAIPALNPARVVSVEVREGEPVRAGQPLARLDTAETDLQIRSLRQEYERLVVEGDVAAAAGQELGMQQARLGAERLRVQLEKLARDREAAVPVAPFDGIVLGVQSLQKKTGQMMKLGETLVEVVSADDWKVQVNLREQDLRFLETELEEKGTLEGSLRLAANPVRPFPLKLEDRSQLAYGLDTSRGDYVFRAVVPLEVEGDRADFLKSGFAGRASFTAGKRPLVYVLFRDFVNFLRLRFS